MAGFEEADLGSIRTYSVKKRKSTVSLTQGGRAIGSRSTFADFWESLPGYLAAADLKALVEHTAAAVEKGKPVLLMMGAHPLKVGLTPVLIGLLRAKVISGIALNGAGAIHDTELACFGKTSEDVAAALEDGSFGMAAETADIINTTISEAARKGAGFGEAMGKRLLDGCPGSEDTSILAACSSLGVPATVHVALGTDIVHQHPSADGAAIGDTSLRDFRIWTRLVAGLHEGGVLLLFGSSVILPEVFLKSLTVARNLYGRVDSFVTAAFDMISHYRPRVNVVERPVRSAGVGYSFTGHHEIMLPLFAAALAERLRL
ncbi:hypothetical protein JXO52_15785 [bacterium]|nr:hypothetical protein [bacterium]